MAAHCPSSLSIALAASFAIIFCFCYCISVTEAARIAGFGFSVELIHHDSPKSPFYNPKETRSQRVANALRRSITRANKFNPTRSVSPDAVESEVISNHGEYLMTYTVGTPPFKILGIADTGSDLIWSQCNPCNACYNQTAPLFDPAKSITYKKVSCAASQCESLGNEASCSLGSCTYAAHYGDQSYSYGDLAFEKLTLGSTNGRPVSFPKTAIGCGHKNDGTFNEKGSGIVGLGGGELSLVSQIKSSIGGKFSYCLVPLFSESSKTSSKLNFGENAIVSGPGTVSTPRVSKSPDTFYYLTLEALSVGEKRLEFFESSSRRSNYVEGNIIIDSGTTLTLLPENVYSRLESAVQESIQAEPVTDPTGVLSLCYSSTGNDIKVPVIIAHFTGADVKLNPVNTFVSVTEDVVCFAFAASPTFSIFGNLAQMNLLVGYDLQKNTVSFKPTDCTKY